MWEGRVGLGIRIWRSQKRGGVRGSYKMPNMDTGTSSGPLEEQHSFKQRAISPVPGFLIKRTLSVIVIIVNVKELQISWWCLLAGKLCCPLLSEFAKGKFMVEMANLLSQTLNLDRKEQAFWDHLVLLTELFFPKFICRCLPFFSVPLRMTVFEDRTGPLAKCLG